MRKTITKEIMDNMLFDYNNGYDLAKLNKKYGFQEQTIRKRFKKYGIILYKKNIRYFSQEEVDNIVEEYQSGIKISELSKKYDRDIGTIIGKLKQLGIYVNKNYHFTDEDLEFLKKYYPLRDWDSINSRFPDIPRSSIHTKMSKLGVRLSDYFWNEKDVKLLKENYSKSYGNIKELIRLFDDRHSYNSILAKANSLGLKSREFWKDSEIIIMNENYSTHTVDEMMRLLPNRNRNSIINKAVNLGLKNKIILETEFTEYERNYVKENYQNMTDKEISMQINRSEQSINSYRFRNNLIKKYEKSSYLDLSEYVRRNNSEWKKESMKKCNYKCVLSGKRFDDIHHIYGLNLILNETLEILNMVLKNDINDYSQKELKDILNTFRKIQNKYPLGVCLTKDIHKKFHNIYGYGNNTKEQWDKFCLEYNKNVA